MKAVPVIALDHPAALDVARVGDDAAALAGARAAGLPVGPGVVLTTAWSIEDDATVELVWRIVSHDGAISLSVRPSPIGSSALEPSSSVHSAAELLAAARAARASNEPDVPVLVQAEVGDDWHGVLVADGTGAKRRRPLVHAGLPLGDWIGELDTAGRVRRVLTGQHLAHPPLEVLARVTRLADRLAAVLGDTADFEFAVVGGHVDVLHVRRSRESAAAVRGDLLDVAA